MTIEKIDDFGKHIRLSIPGGYCFVQDNDGIKLIRTLIVEAEKLVNSGLISKNQIAEYVQFELGDDFA